MQVSSTSEIQKTEWKLHVGIHRGTITSRDMEPVKEYATLSECKEAADQAFKWYDSMGIYCWFCYAVGPDQRRVNLVESTDYDLPQEHQFNHSPSKRLKLAGWDPFDL